MEILDSTLWIGTVFTQLYNTFQPILLKCTRSLSKIRFLPSRFYINLFLKLGTDIWGLYLDVDICVCQNDFTFCGLFRYK